MPTTEASSRWAFASGARCSRRSRANSRPTFPNPARTMRRCVVPRPSDVEDLPEVPAHRRLDREARNGRVLDPDPGQVGDRDLVVGLAPGLQPRGDLTQLRVHVVRPQCARLEGMMDLAEPRALLESVRDDLV